MKFVNTTNLYSLVLSGCFWPISYLKYSINFSYLILFVVFLSLTYCKVNWRASIIFWAAALYFVSVLIVALAFRFIENEPYLMSRTIISFFILCSPFLFFFFYPTRAFKDILCNALVVVGAVYSLHSTFVFFVTGSGKLAIGSSHDIVILLPALSIVCYRILDVNCRSTWATYLLCLLIFSGCLMTYSRAAFVALCVFILFLLFNSIRRVSIRKLQKFLLFVFLLLAWITFYPSLFTYFLETTFQRWFLDNALLSVLDGSASVGGATSESERLSYWKMAYEYTAESYFLGSGYLGMWIIGDPNFTGKTMFGTTQITGSTHSLYVDVFFRTGILGLCFYCYNLAVILKRLSNKNMVYCGAFLAILVACLFNESVKMGHGAAALAFFILISNPEASVVRRN